MPRSAAASPLINRRYAIEKALGEGAMGSVFLARDTHQRNALCAVKLLKPAFTHDPRFGYRFASEASSLARLAHPHIVKMYDFFHDQGTYGIVLEYVSGMSLAELIDRDGALPEKTALPIFKNILSALDYGHIKGIIHRDVKPANILLDPAGSAKLCDFGIAKQVAKRGVTAAGTTLGTVEYMSPEQIQTPQAIDHRSDVYSAGIVLYEMLTGRPPFVAPPGTDLDYSVRKQHVEAEPPDPRRFNPRIDERLVRIVLKAIRKAPGRRYGGCADFEAAIDNYLQPGQSVPPIQRPSPDPIPVGPSYEIYEHPRHGSIAVKTGFSWPALFLNIPWMFSKGLFAHAAVWAGGYIAVCILLSVGDGFALLGAASLIPMLLAPGFLGNQWVGRELVRRGSICKLRVPAPSQEAALALLGKRKSP